MKNKLNDMMSKRNMTPTELAYKANVTERYIYFIAQGVRSPSLKVAMQIARVLKCRVDDIFSLNDSTKRSKTPA